MRGRTHAASDSVALAQRQRRHVAHAARGDRLRHRRHHQRRGERAELADGGRAHLQRGVDLGRRRDRAGHLAGHARLAVPAEALGGLDELRRRRASRRAGRTPSCTSARSSRGSCRRTTRRWRSRARRRRWSPRSRPGTRSRGVTAPRLERGRRRDDLEGGAGRLGRREGDPGERADLAVARVERGDRRRTARRARPPPPPGGGCRSSCAPAGAAPRPRARQHPPARRAARRRGAPPAGPGRPPRARSAPRGVGAGSRARTAPAAPPAVSSGASVPAIEPAIASSGELRATARPRASTLPSRDSSVPRAGGTLRRASPSPRRSPGKASSGPQVTRSPSTGSSSSPRSAPEDARAHLDRHGHDAVALVAGLRPREPAGRGRGARRPVGALGTRARSGRAARRRRASRTSRGSRRAPTPRRTRARCARRPRASARRPRARRPAASTASTRERRDGPVGETTAALGGEVGSPGQAPACGWLPWLRRVTALDWIIVAFTVLMALWGYAQGLIVGALSLAGFAGGRVSRLATRAAAARRRARESPYAPLFALVGALLLGRHPGLGARAARLPAAAPARGAARAWSTASAARCWWPAWAWASSGSAAPWRCRRPGARDLRKPIQRSAILRALNEHLPPSGPILQALARFDPFPQINGPRPDVPAARLADRARPAGARRRPQRRQGARAPPAGWRAGQRLGGGRRRRRDERPRGRGPGRHDRPARRRGPAPRRRGDLVRLPQRPRDPARARPLGGAPALRLDRERPARHLRRDPGLPRERPLRRAARPARATRRR